MASDFDSIFLEAMDSGHRPSTAIRMALVAEEKRAQEDSIATQELQVAEAEQDDTPGFGYRLLEEGLIEPLAAVGGGIYNTGVGLGQMIGAGLQGAGILPGEASESMNDAAASFNRATSQAAAFIPDPGYLIAGEPTVDAFSEAAREQADEFAADGGLKRLSTGTGLMGEGFRNRDLVSGLSQALGGDATNTDPEGGLLSEYSWNRPEGASLSSILSDVGTTALSATQLLADPANKFGAGPLSEARRTSQAVRSSIPVAGRNLAMREMPELAAMLGKDAMLLAGGNQDEILRLAVDTFGEEAGTAMFKNYSAKAAQRSEELLRFAGGENLVEARKYMADAFGPDSLAVRNFDDVAESFMREGAEGGVLGAATFGEQAALGQRSLFPAWMRGDTTRKIDEGFFGSLSALNRTPDSAARWFRAETDTMERLAIGGVAKERAARTLTGSVSQLANVATDSQVAKWVAEAASTFPKASAALGRTAVGAGAGYVLTGFDEDGAMLGGGAGLTLPLWQNAVPWAKQGLEKAGGLLRRAGTSDASQAMTQALKLRVNEFNNSVGIMADALAPQREIIDQELRTAAKMGREEEASLRIIERIEGRKKQDADAGLRGDDFDELVKRAADAYGKSADEMYMAQHMAGVRISRLVDDSYDWFGRTHSVETVDNPEVQKWLGEAMDRGDFDQGGVHGKQLKERSLRDMSFEEADKFMRDLVFRETGVELKHFFETDIRRAVRTEEVSAGKAIFRSKLINGFVESFQNPDMRQQAIDRVMQFRDDLVSRFEGLRKPATGADAASVSAGATDIFLELEVERVARDLGLQVGEVRPAVERFQKLTPEAQSTAKRYIPGQKNTVVGTPEERAAVDEMIGGVERGAQGIDDITATQPERGPKGTNLPPTPEQGDGKEVPYGESPRVTEQLAGAFNRMRAKVEEVLYETSTADSFVADPTKAFDDGIGAVQEELKQGKADLSGARSKIDDAKKQVAEEVRVIQDEIRKIDVFLAKNSTSASDARNLLRAKRQYQSQLNALKKNGSERVKSLEAEFTQRKASLESREKAIADAVAARKAGDNDRLAAALGIAPGGGITPENEFLDRLFAETGELGGGASDFVSDAVKAGRQSAEARTLLDEIRLDDERRVTDEIVAAYGGTPEEAFAAAARDAQVAENLGDDVISNAFPKAPEPQLEGVGTAAGELEGPMRELADSIEADLTRWKQLETALKQQNAPTLRQPDPMTGQPVTLEQAQQEVQRLEKSRNDLIKQIGEFVDEVRNPEETDQQMFDRFFASMNTGAKVGFAKSMGIKAREGFVTALDLMDTPSYRNALPRDLESLVALANTEVPVMEAADFRRVFAAQSGVKSELGRSILKTLDTWRGFEKSILHIPGAGADFLGNVSTATLFMGATPQDYATAAYAFGRFGDQTTVAGKMIQGVMGWLAKKGVLPAVDDVAETVAGKLTLQQRVELARKSGMFRHETHMNSLDMERGAETLQDLLAREESGVKKGAKIAAKGVKATRDEFLGWRSANDDFHRFLAFDKALREGYSVEDSIARGFQYFFDYSDLTKFESSVMRRVGTFYTFAKKSLPLWLRQIVDKPYRLKLMMMSVGLTERNEDFPDYARGMGMHVGSDAMGNPQLVSLGSTLLQPALGIVQSDNLGEAARRLAGMTPNPIRGGLEYATNTDFFTGKKIHNTTAVERESRQTANRAPSWMRHLPAWMQDQLGFNTEEDPVTGQIKGYTMDPEIRWIMEGALPLGPVSNAASRFTDERKSPLAGLAGMAGITARSIPWTSESEQQFRAIDERMSRMREHISKQPGRPFRISNNSLVPDKSTRAGKIVAQTIEEATASATQEARALGLRGEQRVSFITQTVNASVNRLHRQYGAAKQAWDRMRIAYRVLKERRDGTRLELHEAAAMELGDELESRQQDALDDLASFDFGLEAA